MPLVRTPVVDFWVTGVPKPQGSKTAFVLKKAGRPTNRAVVTESAGAALKIWRQDVRLEAVAAMGTAPPLAQPTGVHVRIGFVLSRPKATPKTRETPLAVKLPDLDKLIRATCDALTNVVYVDDSQVVSFDCWKRLAEIDERTGAQITITRLDQK